MRQQALRTNLQNLIAPILIVAAWQLAVGGLEIPTRYLPSPSVIFMTLWHQPVAFGTAMGTTLLEAVIGIVLGTFVGVVSGVVFFRFHLLERMFFPYFVASQAVPIIAFGALVIMWFGNGIAAKAFIALYLTFFPVAVNTLRGLRSVDPRQVDLLRTFGASSTTIFLKLQFPGALPSIFTAVRLGASLGLVGAIVGEWFGAQSGLGAILLLSMHSYQLPELWAAIVLTGIAGTMLFGVVALLQHQLAWWTEEL
jgi:NitT/TauT family transport system permease protein